LQKLERRVHLRRHMLFWHQILGFITLGALAATDIIGTLNYVDKFGGGNASGAFQQAHIGLAAGTTITFATTAALALFAPNPYPKALERRDRRSGVFARGFGSILRSDHLSMAARPTAYGASMAPFAPILFWNRTGSSGRTLLSHVGRQRGDGRERLLAHNFVRDADAVLAIDGNRQLEGVEAVEPQPVLKQRGIVDDLLRRHVEQVQARDDQLLDLLL
jgi:hypothetical protein